MVLAQALGGELKAVELVWNRIEDKALDRQEHGQPGDFSNLREIPDDALKSTLALVDDRPA